VTTSAPPARPNCAGATLVAHETRQSLPLREKDDGIHECFVIVYAVENEVVVRWGAAVHGERRAARLAEAKGLGIVICSGGRSVGLPRVTPGPNQGNLCEIAAVQRQFGGLASFDNLSDAESAEFITGDPAFTVID